MLKIINPYPGFESGFYRPYLEDEFPIFFGRDKDISMLKLKIRQKKLVSLISEPKMGKTSLLRAGLIPNLRENAFDGHNGSEWKCLYMMPETRPIHALAKALVNPDNKLSDKIKPSMEEEVLQQLQRNDYGLVRVAESIIGDRNINLLLVVDDFYDIFQNEVDPKERLKFLKLLHKSYLDKNTPFHIVACFNKDDFKSEKMRLEPKLYKALTMGMHKVKFLDNAGLQDAIEKPAKLTNSIVANDLSNEMMLMLLQDNDQLRKLQLLMSRTWMEWKRNHKDKTVTKAHYFRATGQKSKAVAKGLMKGGKISVDHLETLAKQSAQADTSEMAKVDYSKLNDEHKTMFKRIIPHLIDDSGPELKSSPVDRKKVGELLGVTMEELGILVTKIPTILAMDRKKLSINQIDVFDSWDEIKDWIRNNNTLKLKFEQVCEAAILHYIEGIELASVVSRQQYKDLFRFVDVEQITETWAQAQHEQYALGLDFIGKLQETYGVLEYEEKKSGVKKKMSFGRKPGKEKDKQSSTEEESGNVKDEEAAIRELLGHAPQSDSEPKQAKVDNNGGEIDEDEAIRRLLEGATESKEKPEIEESLLESDLSSEMPIKIEAKKPKLAIKPKAKIVLKGKGSIIEKELIDKNQTEVKKVIKPKIVIKKK